MKFFILSLDPASDSELIKAVEEFQDNGHQLVNELQDADMLIIAPDITMKINEINVVGYESTKRTKTFSNWKNLSYRTFFK